MAVLWWWPFAPWLSPAAAWFIFFNAVVGAIALMPCAAHQAPTPAARRRLCRSASSVVLDRLRSFSIFSVHGAAGGVTATPIVADTSAASDSDFYCYGTREAEEARAAHALALAPEDTRHSPKAVAATTVGTAATSSAATSGGGGPRGARAGTGERGGQGRGTRRGGGARRVHQLGRGVRAGATASRAGASVTTVAAARFCHRGRHIHGDSDGADEEASDGGGGGRQPAARERRRGAGGEGRALHPAVPGGPQAAAAQLHAQAQTHPRPRRTDGSEVAEPACPPPQIDRTNGFIRILCSFVQTDVRSSTHSFGLLFCLVCSSDASPSKGLRQMDSLHRRPSEGDVSDVDYEVPCITGLCQVRQHPDWIVEIYSPVLGVLDHHLNLESCSVLVRWDWIGEGERRRCRGPLAPPAAAGGGASPLPSSSAREDLLRLLIVLAIAAAAACSLLNRRPEPFCDSLESPNDYADGGSCGTCVDGKLECVQEFKRYDRSCIEDGLLSQIATKIVLHLRSISFFFASTCYATPTHNLCPCFSSLKILKSQLLQLRICDQHARALCGLINRKNLVSEA